MAEYIDRNELELDAEWSEYHDGFTAYSQGQIQCAPTADVIERSKIDEALADMQSMLDQEVLNDNVISDVGQGIEIAMGLLKENIGE